MECLSRVELFCTLERTSIQSSRLKTIIIGRYAFIVALSYIIRVISQKTKCVKISAIIQIAMSGKSKQSLLAILLHSYAFRRKSRAFVTRRVFSIVFSSSIISVLNSSGNANIKISVLLCAPKCLAVTVVTDGHDNTCKHTPDSPRGGTVVFVAAIIG